MSMASKEDNDVSVCANCGKGEEESDKLKACTACKTVKYCNRECQIAHRPKHKKECKKRAAELHDEALFKEPPNLYEDCPICFLHMPILETGNKYMSCCGKVICSGCDYAPLYDHQGNKVEKKCPYCRAPNPASYEEAVERMKKLVQAGDPIAIRNIGWYYRDGLQGYPQSYAKALELFHRSAELGNAEAYTNIGVFYYNGRGTEVDKKKAKHYYELAAMRGDSMARHNLGVMEGCAGNWDRALKHFMVAVKGGYAKSMERIKWLYSNGHATKDNYTTALQLYQSYLGEIKSVQRDKAAAAREDHRYYY